MRLIDADAINGTFAPSERYTGNEVMALLNQIPTAYDVDKVVEQIKDESHGMDLDESDYVVEKEKAIEIVKGGGINE